jgi:hypothetical protein
MFLEQALEQEQALEVLEIRQMVVLVEELVGLEVEEEEIHLHALLQEVL